jgi:hypothetical protein
LKPDIVCIGVSAAVMNNLRVIIARSIEKKIVEPFLLTDTYHGAVMMMMMFFVEDFFDNIGAITLYASFGTIISTFTVGCLSFYAARLGLIRNVSQENPIEALLFGALISSVDPGACVRKKERKKNAAIEISKKKKRPCPIIFYLAIIFTFSNMLFRWLTFRRPHSRYTVSEKHVIAHSNLAFSLFPNLVSDDRLFR